MTKAISRFEERLANPGLVSKFVHCDTAFSVQKLQNYRD